MGVIVIVGVGDNVGVRVGVSVGVRDAVGVRVGVSVGVRVRVSVGDGVRVGVPEGVRVRVGCGAQGGWPSSTASSALVTLAQSADEIPALPTRSVHDCFNARYASVKCAIDVRYRVRAR